MDSKMSGYISFSSQEKEILRGTDINKQKTLVKMKLDEFNGSNIEDFFWFCITLITAENNSLNAHDNDPQVFKQRNDDYAADDDVDEKQMAMYDDRKQTKSISMLIDFEKAKKYEEGMCPKGDVFDITEAYNPEENLCIECGCTEDVKRCVLCSLRDDVSYEACKDCRFKNLSSLEYQNKMEKIISVSIRTQLLLKPALSLDISCGLPTAKALDQLMEDIIDLHSTRRSSYSVFLLDLDNLKALNSILSYQGANEVIKHVGLTLKRWCDKVNKGEVSGLAVAYPFRQGGDEFAVVVNTEDAAQRTSLSNFYYGWKNEINNLVHKQFMVKFKPSERDIKEGIETLRDRKKKKIKTSLAGVEIDEMVMQKISEAVNKMDIKFGIEKIGLSVGLFIPKGSGNDSKETDWLKCAEIAQAAAKDIKGKNQISIFYEEINGIVPQNKIECYLKDGTYYAHQNLVPKSKETGSNLLGIPKANPTNY